MLCGNKQPAVPPVGDATAFLALPLTFSASALSALPSETLRNFVNNHIFFHFCSKTATTVSFQWSVELGELYRALYHSFVVSVLEVLVVSLIRQLCSSGRRFCLFFPV